MDGKGTKIDSSSGSIDERRLKTGTSSARRCCDCSRPTSSLPWLIAAVSSWPRTSCCGWATKSALKHDVSSCSAHQPCAASEAAESCSENCSRSPTKTWQKDGELLREGSEGRSMESMRRTEGEALSASMNGEMDQLPLRAGAGGSSRSDLLRIQRIFC